jgi:hypothetical protein
VLPCSECSSDGECKEKLELGMLEAEFGLSLIVDLKASQGSLKRTNLKSIQKFDE